MDNYCTKCFAKQPHEQREGMWQGIFSKDEETLSDVSTECESCPEVPSLNVGMAVRIHGLKSATDLNGRVGWIVKCLVDSGRFSVKLKGAEGTKALKGINLKRLDGVKPLCLSKILVQKDRSRCWFCSKKCGLTGFACRCGFTFCSRHRHAEDHECDFDHQKFGQELLQKCNPRLQAQQLELSDAL